MHARREIYLNPDAAFLAGGRPVGFDKTFFGMVRQFFHLHQELTAFVRGVRMQRKIHKMQRERVIPVKYFLLYLLTPTRQSEK